MSHRAMGRAGAAGWAGCRVWERAAGPLCTGHGSWEGVRNSGKRGQAGEGEEPCLGGGRPRVQGRVWRLTAWAVGGAVSRQLSRGRVGRPSDGGRGVRGQRGSQAGWGQEQEISGEDF